MRTKPNVSVEHHDALYKSLDDEAADAMRIARSVLPCSECGSDFGMIGGWTREFLLPTRLDLLEIFLTGITLFHHQDDDHELYQTCRQCNPNEIVPNDFTSLTPEQVVAWLARECQCEDCTRERRE